MEQEDNQEEEEGERNLEDTSGNQTSPEFRRIQDSLSQIFQTAFQGVNIDSFSDGSSNLLYEFQFPIYTANQRTDNPYNYGDDEIQDNREVD
jgi:hypothetical protein